MKRVTVDLVVTGHERAAVATAADAVRSGLRVLVVLRSGDARVRSRIRQLSRVAKNQLIVMTNAEVVCVDGVGGVEAVIVRYARTGRLCGVNTPAFVTCGDSIERCCRGTIPGHVYCAAPAGSRISAASRGQRWCWRNSLVITPLA